MPTEEEAHAWLAHALANNELAHYGVLGMKWGQRKSKPPASGIKSAAVDKMAKSDAKEHAKAYLNPSQFEHEANYARKLVTRRVDQRSAKNPDYAKAFAYHKSKAEHKLKVVDGIATGVVWAGAAAYVGYAYKDFLMRAAGSAALKVAARRGAKAAAPVLKAIGNKPIVLMAQGLDGIWRLAA